MRVLGVTTLVAMAATALVACSPSAPSPSSGEGQEAALTVPAAGAVASDPVIASAVYALEVGESAQATRIAELSAIVDALRAASTSGWQARQSDSSGYAAEVAGGRLPVEGSPVQAVESFMTQYGALFGPADGLVFSEDGYDDAGHATVRVEQRVGDAPVDGGLLVASVRERGAVVEVESVVGQLVDVAGVASQPSVTAAEAVGIVAEGLGVAADEEPTLFVTMDGAIARLAWAVTVTSGPTDESDSILGGGVQYPAVVLVDAVDGAIIGHRRAATSPQGRGSAAAALAQPSAASSAAVDYGNFAFEIPSGGRPIVIKDAYLGKIPIEVNALRLPDGSIVLVDLTGPGADARTRKGVIVGLDGRGLTGNEPNPVAEARLVRYKSVDDIPKDALYAMWGARKTLDYLKSDLGMLSYDGRNAPVPIVYNFTYGDSCLDNAYFATAPGASYMAVGVPCPDARGNRIATVADIDTIAHELGHGVIHSHTFTRDTIQQGALDEGIADYLGMILRNGVYREASPMSSADICKGFPGEHPWCKRWKDGIGIRSLNTGATFDQYAFTVEDGLYNTVLDRYSDSGHTNSMVWTNALWQARRAVASLDGGDMTKSPRVKLFDRAVIRAATRLTPGTNFVEAAEAVLRSATEAGLSARDLELIRDRFRANRVCSGCTTLPLGSGSITPAAVSTDVKSNPVALDGKVAFLLTTPGDWPRGVVAALGATGQQQVGPPASVTLHIAGEGTTVLQAQVSFTDDGGEAYQLGLADTSTGDSSVLTEDINPSVAPAVSAEAYAWVDLKDRIVYRPRSGGSVSRLPAKGTVAQLATSGDKVAMLMADGRLRVWTVSSGKVRDLAIYDPSPIDSFASDEFTLPLGSLAMSGDRIAVVGSTVRAAPVQVFDLATNAKTTMKAQAFPLGVAISDDYVVWVEAIGDQDSPIYGEDADAYKFPDTELRGYAFADQKTYRMVNARGEQAFPSLSDTLLAWQETGNGNSDIYVTRLEAR